MSDQHSLAYREASQRQGGATCRVCLMLSIAVTGSVSPPILGTRLVIRECRMRMEHSARHGRRRTGLRCYASMRDADGLADPVAADPTRAVRRNRAIARISRTPSTTRLISPSGSVQFPLSSS